MKRLLVLVSVLLLATPAMADEGMWLFNDFPSAEVERLYGFSPSKKWLEGVQKASVRLAGGCSGSFVSANGLVLTNHHCAAGCIQQLSNAERNLLANGFVASKLADEISCPAIELNQLLEITDVTEKVLKAGAGLADAEFITTIKGEMSKIETECSQKGKWRCDVVTLYQGGAYHLYKYKRYQDVRLAFAPELDSAFFGGDPDNFTFPRYNLDAALIRAYENGKPAKTPNYLRFSKAGAAENELVFVTGHPGSTQRLLTISQLAFQRDVALPNRLMYLAELRGLLTEFGRRGEEQARIASGQLFWVENAFKALKGRFEALLDADQFGKKIAQEQDMRSKAGQEAWETIDHAVKASRDLYDSYLMIEAGRAFPGDLFRIARTLVRGATERAKPNEERLREFSEAGLPTLEQRLFSKAPIYPDLEQILLEFGLTKLRETLGTDHPTVKKILGKDSPENLARTLIQNTGLADVDARKGLWEGGQAAIDSSLDPMILFARLIDDDARDFRKTYENVVEAPILKASETIAKARFSHATEKLYPDATFTLRMTYGTVKGYEERGAFIHPITTVDGLYERATGKAPYALPRSWIESKDSLDMKTPMNFASTCDIIGGNSGSPVVNKNGQVVGLIFDGNIQSLGGDYWFDESVNRAVAVASPIFLEALQKVYKADRLLKELTK